MTKINGFRYIRTNNTDLDKSNSSRSKIIGYTRNGRTKPKCLSDGETTGNTAFCFLLPNFLYYLWRLHFHCISIERFSNETYAVSGSSLNIVLMSKMPLKE